MNALNVVITAGPTREMLDPVRFISNRSSGKMGYALAEAAKEKGAQVTLISGPVALVAPKGVQLISVVSAREMSAAVLHSLPAADVLIMAAAVSDYALEKPLAQKHKKNEDTWALTLVRTPDILQQVAQVPHRCFVVGFAAESENLLMNAEQKLRDKKMDMIVANNIAREDVGFDSKDNEGSILYADGARQDLAKCGKLEFAKLILAAIEQRRKKVSACM